jgi:hypothetical protein
VKISLRHELGLNGITQVALAKQSTRRGILGSGVATLYHEVLDYAMEKERVKLMFLDKLDEVVPVLGSLIIKAEVNYTGCGVHAHFHIL